VLRSVDVILGHEPHHARALLIAQYGGQVISEETSLRPLAAALECPLLLVR